MGQSFNDNPINLKGYYKSQDVCKITGLTYKQLDYYDRTDFLKPSISQGIGYGSKRMYSFNDLLKLKVVKSLLDAGVSLHKVRKTKKYLELTGDGDDDFLKVKDAYFSTKAFLKDIPADVKKKVLKSVSKNTKRNALK